MTISYDMEWTRDAIDVLGLSWDEGRKATATGRTPETMSQFLDILHKAERIAGHNAIDADLGQLEKEGFDISQLLGKTFDTRVAFHAVNGHLAGTGSFDLRSVVLLLGAKQGFRFPLDFKQYASDLHRTCAMDAAAVSWCVPTLDRLITQHKLESTVNIGLQCSDIFRRMARQGVRLDPKVLGQIHEERKNKATRLIEQYHLWEERGKKKIKRVPIWRSNKILEIFTREFGVSPKDRQRKTLEKFSLNASTPPRARELASVIIDLGKGANDAHWLGSAEEGEDGLSFDKVGKDGFIYPRYDICGSPDRAIASGPNIQNFPRPSDDPRPIPLRSAVVPLDSSHTILGVDFGSVETITNAYESRDMDRVQAVLTKRISHQGTADTINKAFGLSLNRAQGKVCNHAFDKGESPWNLACRIFATERPSRQQSAQCLAIFEHMLTEFPNTAKFRDDLWARSVENPLVVTNSFGRKLMCFSRAKYGDADERLAKHVPARKYWCTCKDCAPRRDRFKYAIAFLGRSAAFDALLRVMSKIWYERRLDQYSLPYLEVHDELDFSIPIDKVAHYTQIATEAFQEPIPELGGLSLPAEAKHGRNWAESH